MAQDEIRKGDIGTVLECLIKDGVVIVPLTGYTIANIILQKPDGTIVTKPGVVPVPETQGLVTYTTTALSDLDQTGCWQIQAHIAIPGGDWKSDIDTFKVHPNLV